MEGFEFRTCEDWGLRLQGLFPGAFCRMDPAVLPGMLPNIQELAWNTSCAAVRFRLEGGGRFAVRMKLGKFAPFAHMPSTGQAGLDVYLGSGDRDSRFWQNFRPEVGETLVEGECQLPGKCREAVLYLPLYAPVSSFELGLPQGEQFLPPRPCAQKKPLMLYGSSITQGACAARPGNCYALALAREVNCEVHNLGFSGSAKGDMPMARYLAEQPMCALVYDYDFNAPDADHLRRTHKPFLEYVLKRQPDLPVLIVSKPNYGREEGDQDRRAVVMETFLWAKSAGYKVEFVDGAAVFGGLDPGMCTVDGTHPTDLGFYHMTRAMAPALKRLLAEVL